MSATDDQSAACCDAQVKLAPESIGSGASDCRHSARQGTSNTKYVIQ